MEPILQVCLLGSFELRYKGETLNTFHSIRLQSLLAYILLHRRTAISRQQLAGIFWPDTSEAQARTNLRNLIHQLRQAFPACDDFVHSDAYSLEWQSDSPYSLDVGIFENCLAVKNGQPVSRELLEQAVQVYQGDLLPDCYEDWIGPIRERLYLAYLTAVEALATIAEEGREYSSALEFARRLVEADPLHPKFNCQLVRLYSLIGDRPAALKAYQAYAQRLFQELGTEPDPELQELYRRLAQGNGNGKPVVTKTLIPLVGRKTEWRQLLAAWQSAVDGAAHMVFISGEAGIGKSRLVEELQGWARSQGIQTAAAYCYPAEGSLPYAPVVSWLRARPLPPLEKVWLIEVARLLPEIQQKNSGLAPPEALHETWQRQRLFEALGRALSVKQQAQLLVLEDIHWCDRDTLEWLHYLLRYAPQARLLIAATVRSEEVEPDHPLTALRNALQAEDRCSELNVKPLNESETCRLAGYALLEVANQNLSAEAASEIYQASEGNPFFVIEMVRLQQALPGNLTAESEAWAASQKVRAVLARRIGQLGPNTREITALAAAIGRAFSLQVLRTACDESEAQIASAMDELLQRQIVREISSDVYDFTHDLLRQAAFGHLSTAHRRLLHRKVAEAYQRLDQTAFRPRHAEIASQYEHAGLFLQAIQHYQLAAENAMSVFANGEALHHIQQAVELAEMVGVEGNVGISQAEFVRLLEKMGDLLALDGKYPQARACYERTLALTCTPPCVWRSQVYRKITDCLVPQYSHAPEAHHALDQAEQALQYSAESGTLEELQEWIQIQLDRIQLYYWSNQPDQMEAIIQKIEPEVKSRGRIDQKIRLLSHQYQARMRHERYRLSTETIALVLRRLELTEKLSDPYEQAVAQFQYGFAYLWYGDLPRARDGLVKALEATSRIGARILQVRSLTYLSVVYRWQNECAALAEVIPPLLEQSLAIGEYFYYGIGLANLGWKAWKEGDTARAERLCNDAKKAWDNAAGAVVFHMLVDWVLLAIAVARGNLSQAEACAQSLLDPDPTYRPVEEPAASLLRQALSACQAQDEERALYLFNLALEEARMTHEL